MDLKGYIENVEALFPTYIFKASSTSHWNHRPSTIAICLHSLSKTTLSTRGLSSSFISGSCRDVSQSHPFVKFGKAKIFRKISLNYI